MVRSANRPEAGQRQLRVAEQIRHALADVLRRGHFRDPDLFDANIIVTEVRISPDLRNATAFVSALGGDDQEKIVKALKRASAYIRGQLAKSIDFRHVPTIGFQPDESFDEAEKINRILHSPEVSADLDSPIGGLAGDDDEDDDLDDRKD